MLTTLAPATPSAISTRYLISAMRASRRFSGLLPLPHMRDEIRTDRLVPEIISATEVIGLNVDERQPANGHCPLSGRHTPARVMAALSTMAMVLVSTRSSLLLPRGSGVTDIGLKCSA
jgi:hypothetical protein